MRCLAIDRTWRALIGGLKPFASAESHETAVNEQVGASKWVASRKKAAKVINDALRVRRDNERKAVEALRKNESADAKRRSREAQGILEPQKLKGWSDSRGGGNEKDGGGRRSMDGSGTTGQEEIEIVLVPQEPLTPEEELKKAVAKAVEGAMKASGEGKAVTAEAAAAALASMATAADKVELTKLDCAQPLLFALLAPAISSDAATKKARITASKKRLALGEELLKGLGSGALFHAALLAAVVTCCEGEEKLGEIFEHLLLQLYELEGELLPEIAIFAWADGASKAPEGSSLQKLHSQSTAFLQWLKEAEEEEEDSD